MLLQTAVFRKNNVLWCLYMYVNKTQPQFSGMKILRSQPQQQKVETKEPQPQFSGMTLIVWLFLYTQFP